MAAPSVGDDLRGGRRARQRAGEYRVDGVPTQRCGCAVGLLDASLRERRVQLALSTAQQVPLGLPVTS